MSFKKRLERDLREPRKRRYAPPKYTRISLRFPDRDLHDRVKAHCHRLQVSVNRFMIALLEQVLGDSGELKP